MILQRNYNDTLKLISKSNYLYDFIIIFQDNIEMMDYNKQTQETKSDFTQGKFEEFTVQNNPVTSSIPFANYDSNNRNQDFYKIYNRAANGQLIMKHGYRIFTINRSEQDLTVFCLSLLQFQAQFPLRFFMIDLEKKENDLYVKQAVFKDIWIETQFMVSSNTSKEGHLSKEVQLERRIYRFFKQSLIPVLAKFKEERINWAHMTSQNYTDQKVINDFNQFIIKRINKSFKGYCSQM